ncbi:MAG: MerR family transcriptional regulator [Porticoccus sp.]|nr:MerR family transcriptional regulator [Porticoccus sp.]
MSKHLDISESVSSGLYPIRTVSQLTGINAITLRAWESRHGLIEPARKDSGHRLYTQENIDLIIRVAGLIDRGMRIGQIKTFLETEKEEKLALKSDQDQEKEDTWRRYIEGMTAAIVNFNENGLEKIYNEALSHYPIETVTTRLLMPLLVELGKRWEMGIGTIAEEHFFGFYLRNKLGARFHHRSRNTSGPRLLMACLPGERHEVGLLLFALAANEAGYRTIILGSDMPLQEIYSAVVKTDCDGIVLSGYLVPSPEIMKKQLPSLANSTNIPIFIGGHISAQTFDELKNIGIEPLGADIEMGLKRILPLIPVG